MQAGQINMMKKTNRKKKSIVVFFAVLMGFVLSVCLLFYILRFRGLEQIRRDTVGSISGMQMKKGHTRDLDLGLDATERASVKPDPYPEGVEEKEGRVFYEGRAYDFKEDILTFLVMGIDQTSETVKEQTEGYDGGSADAIFLVVLDPYEKKLAVVAIDRNTMTDVDMYSYYGEYVKTVQAQIAVQHGFGDGTVKSAEYMEKAVSRLLYGLPINGYCAINMSAIEKINDGVGGVDLVVLEDLTKWDKTLVKGAEVHLEGKSAFYYLHHRDTGVFASAQGRLERQRQYIGKFIEQAKKKFLEDPTLPVRMFEELGPYMTTDLTVEKAAYLAGLAAEFDFKRTDIRKIEGETVMGEKYEEFYVDEDAMYELILEIFYKEVE